MHVDFSFLDKTKKYLVAVSGGADSMALLDMAKKEGLDLVVAHVNYHFRESSNRDELIVKTYCSKHNIPFYKDEPKKEEKGNLEQWARESRYKFFKKIYDEVNASKLLVAHHRDDVIETYIFKQNRSSIGEYLTLPKNNYMFGMNIYRPLYEQNKKSLLDYCYHNNIVFGEDETNKSSVYTRNKIRKELLSKNEEELNNLFINIVKENEKWMENLGNILKEYKGEKELIFSKLLNETIDSQILILYYYITSNYKSSALARNLSRNRILDMLEKLKNKANIEIKLIDDFYLVKEYDKLFVKKMIFENYEYTLEKFEFLKTPYFEIGLFGKNMEGVHVLNEDYPLTIRPYKTTDVIVIKDGHKKVSRLYIDKKISREIRNLLPVVLNNKNEVLLIPGIYKDLKRKSLQSNFFMIKYHKY